MRRGFGLIGLLATVILLVIVGAIAYNIGYSDGLSTHLPAVTNNGDGAPGPYPYGYYGHPFGVGFGIFGIFWFLLILFGIFWLLRLAFFGFWGRRMWGGGGWGYGRGFGPGSGQGGPGRWGSFEERAQEWHRKQHGDTTPPTPPPPTDTRSV
jgi:hypothetical protein